MDSLSFGEDNSYDALLSYSSNYSRKGDISISDELADFQKLRVSDVRISALTKAAAISPYVKEVTIGPNSPIKKEPEPEEPVPPVKEEEIDEEKLIEDKLRNDLRYTLIMKEYEAKLKEASETIFKSLVEKMIVKRSETMQRCRMRQAQESQKHLAEIKKLQLQNDLIANDNLTILEMARLDQQKSQMLNKKRIENMNRVLEEQNKATVRFAVITDAHTKICMTYNKITNLLNTEPFCKEIFNKYVLSINTVITNITSIMDVCTSDATTDKEVTEANLLSLNIDNIWTKIVDEINGLKQEEKKKKEEEALKLKETEEKKAQEMKAAQDAKELAQKAEQNKKAPMFHSPTNFNYYQELKQFLKQYESQYEDLSKLKRFRFDCQKAVNTPVNAISSVSGMHMRDKYDKLSKLLKGETVQVLDTYVTATQHPQGLAYVTALLAKKIVRQGDLLVSSNPEAAFPLAAITVALWSQFPEFGKLLEANFHRLCPYLVPMFLPQKEGQSDKEFYLSRGYTYNDEGVVEKQDKFLKRMSGIFRLRCAIWIARTPKFLNTSNPNNLRYAWQWLASFINLKPEPDISATLLHDFFSVCGSEFFKQYGKQFTKIIKLISTDYLAKLQNIDEGGPKTRLEVFLQTVMKTGVIKPPDGLLSPNTW